MQILIWIGAVLSALGLLGVLWCIRKATWLKRVDPAEVDGQAELNRLMMVHMASICGAFLGLGVLVAGILLN